MGTWHWAGVWGPGACGWLGTLFALTRSQLLVTLGQGALRMDRTQRAGALSLGSGVPGPLQLCQSARPAGPPPPPLGQRHHELPPPVPTQGTGRRPRGDVQHLENQTRVQATAAGGGQPGQRARRIAPTPPHPPGHLPHRSTCYRPETQVLKCEPSLNEILAIVSNHRPQRGRASKGTGRRAQSHGSLRANSPSEGHGWSPSGWGGGGRAGVPNVGHTGVSLTVQAGTHPYTHTHTHTPTPTHHHPSHAGLSLPTKSEWLSSHPPRTSQPPAGAGHGPGLASDTKEPPPSRTHTSAPTPVTTVSGQLCPRPQRGQIHCAAGPACWAGQCPARWKSRPNCLAPAQPTQPGPEQLGVGSATLFGSAPDSRPPPHAPSKGFFLGSSGTQQARPSSGNTFSGRNLGPPQPTGSTQDCPGWLGVSGHGL